MKVTKEIIFQKAEGDGERVENVKPANYNAEEVTDKLIRPLFEQLHDLCIEHNIPLLAAVQYKRDDEGTGIHSACHLHPDMASHEMYLAHMALHKGERGLKEHFVQDFAEFLKNDLFPDLAEALKRVPEGSTVGSPTGCRNSNPHTVH